MMGPLLKARAAPVSPRTSIARMVRDALAGLVLFTIFTVILSADSPAGFSGSDWQLAFSSAPADRLMALTTAAVAFSAFFAFNVGIWRHLRQTASASSSRRQKANGPRKA